MRMRERNALIGDQTFFTSAGALLVVDVCQIVEGFVELITIRLWNAGTFSKRVRY